MGMFDQPIGRFNYGGVGQQPVIKFMNTLTPDQIKMLMQNSEQFSLRITEEEMLRAICNHRNLEGTGDALTYDSVTGEAKCTICGYKFRPIEPDVSPDEIVNDVLRIEDILQTIKLMYIDLPAEASTEFFPIIALLDKVPKLFEYSIKNMAKHETNSWQWNNRNMGAINLFNNLQNMFGGMNGMNGMNGAQGAGMGSMGTGASTGMGTGMGGFGYPGASGQQGNPAAAYMYQMMQQKAAQEAAAAAAAGTGGTTAGGFKFNPGGVASPTGDTAPTSPNDTTTVTTTINA